MKRIFCHSPLEGTLILSGSEHHHLANVLRAKVNEQVIAICGDEFNYVYQIEKITKNESVLRLTDKKTNEANPAVCFTVYLALIKPDNLALAVKALNEIGVAELRLFNSANCNSSPKSLNVSKLQTAAEQSCKQCGRSIPLAIKDVYAFEQMIKSLEEFDQVLFADESESARQRLDDVSIPKNQRVALVVGCEGGFTPAEREVLRKLATAVNLGNRILRAETAAIVSSAVVLAKMGEI